MTRVVSTPDLTAHDAVVYLLNTDKRLLTLLAKYANDPGNIEKRDRVLDQIDAIDRWLTVMRRCVVEGRLGT